MSIDDEPVTTLDDLKGDLAGRHKWMPSGGASVPPFVGAVDGLHPLRLLEQP